MNPDRWGWRGVEAGNVSEKKVGEEEKQEGEDCWCCTILRRLFLETDDGGVIVFSLFLSLRPACIDPAQL